MTNTLNEMIATRRATLADYRRAAATLGEGHADTKALRSIAHSAYAELFQNTTRAEFLHALMVLGN